MVPKGVPETLLGYTHISDQSSHSYLNMAVQRYGFNEYLTRLHVFRI